MNCLMNAKQSFEHSEEATCFILIVEYSMLTPICEECFETSQTYHNQSWVNGWFRRLTMEEGLVMEILGS